MPAYPGHANTFVPSFDASGHLVVSYSRNPKDFALNSYVTITPVKKSVGYYLNITAEQAARVLQTDLRDRIWYDGNDEPAGTWGTESHDFKKFSTERYVFPFRLGYKATEEADWKILASHAAINAQAAMTGRANHAITELSNTANYDASHTATATAIGGAKWDVATTANMAIKKSLLKAAAIIHKDTLGVVQPKDLVLVLNPNDALLVAASPEIVDQFKQTPFVKEWSTTAEDVKVGRWGLPPYLYGFKVEVDDTVKITSQKGAAKVSGYAMADAKAMLVARPGGLTSNEGAASFSTGHFFMLEEMTVEQKDDPDNRRIKGRIVEDWDFRVVAPASGFVFTATTG